MGTLMQDVKYGCRMLIKSPGFTIIAVLALALGIGANTAMFSYVNAWVLHPLPYPHSDKLVLLLGENKTSGSLDRMISAGDFYDLQRESRDFEDLCAWTITSMNLTGDSTPERVDGYRVSWNFFNTLGAQAALGRTFLPQEDQPGAAHVAILSRGLWESRFAADPNIIGRKIQIDGETHVVVGIMPAKFQLPLTGESNVWVPLALSAEQRADRQRPSRVFVAGRFKSGTALAQAQGELSGIAAQLQKAYPNTNADSGIVLHTLEYEIGSNQGNSEVLVCFWIVGLVLLMACANVANMMLARATARSKELAVRAALGAGRGRLIRQLVTETVLLFLGASVAGIVVAYWTIAWIATAIPAHVRGYLTNYGEVNLDYQALLYALVVAFVAGVTFGVAPAISGSRLDVFSTLKDSSGRASSNRQGSRLRSGFVVTEIALAVVVVVCSTVLAAKFLGLIRQNPGFQPENVVATQLDLPDTKYKTPAERRNFFDQLVDRVRALPQVEAAAASETVPFGECCAAVPVFATDKPAPRSSDVPYAEFSAVTPDYFSAVQIGLLRGRYFKPADGPDASAVTVINQTLANYFWPDADAIGQKLRFTTRSGEHLATVVGIVRDVKLYNSTSGRHDREIYVPFDQLPTSSMGIVARSRGDQTALVNAIRSAVWSIDADQPVSSIRPIQGLMDDQYAGFRIVTELLGDFSALALFLGAIGIYAVMAFNVAQRTHEMGIRLALGAHPTEIVRLVLGSGARLTAIGMGVGIIVSLGATRLLSSILVSVDSTAEGVLQGRVGTAPLAFAGAVLVLVFVALVACYIPARRAMRVDPIVALRHE